MNKIKRVITILIASTLLVAFVSLPAEAVTITPRTMLHLDIWGDAPSNRISLKARISVNDATNKIVGTLGVIDYMWGTSVDDSTIKWTSLSISSDSTYAYCAVSYKTNSGKSYAETIKFYP